MLPPVDPVLVPPVSAIEPALIALPPEVMEKSPALPATLAVPVAISIEPETPLVAAPEPMVTLPVDALPDEVPTVTLPPTCDALAPLER